MTIKEITALRKSGQLQEALQAAEAEFANSANRYTAGALYWCLNDLYKQQNHDEAVMTIERMKVLTSEYGEGDELMHKALDRAYTRILPYYDEIQNILKRAKSGEDIRNDYHTMENVFTSSELDSSLYSDFGWIVYYTLRSTPFNEANNRKLLLSRYLELNLPTPSILHSLILAEAVKTEQNTPLQFRIRDFITLWGLENLRESDWEQFTTDSGHTLPSLVEKLIGVYAKEIKTDNVAAPEEFNLLVDKALERYPQNQNMPYFKATVLISQGKKEEAIGYYKDLILRFPPKFHLWSQLAELVEDQNTKIGLLCKALKSGTEDIFLGGVRLRLASLLIAKGLPSNAKYELTRYKETYNAQGWKLKPEYWQLSEQLTNFVSVEDNENLYSQYSPTAEDFIYSALSSEIAIKVSEKLMDDRRRPGKRFMQWILRTRNKTFRLKNPLRLGLQKSRNSTLFEIKVLDNKIVWIKPSQANPIQQDWIKKLEGSIKLRKDRNGKSYAILQGAYIEERLLKSISSGQNVKIIAIRQDDGRWSAISLTPLPNHADQ